MEGRSEDAIREELEDDGGFLSTAAKVAGLLAGAVAAVYLLGGIVIALRLLFDGFSAGTVVTLLGQLPRELVITTAMLEVIGLAAIVGIAMALWFGGWDGPRERRPATNPKRARDKDKLSSKPRRGLTLAFLAVIALLLMVPAFVQATDAEGHAETARLIAVGFGLLITFALVAAGWFLIRRLARYEVSRLPKAAAAGGIWAIMALVPALMFAGLLDFEDAQACTEGSATPVRGVLVGETPEHLLLATDFENEESVLSLRADRVTKSEYGDLTTKFLCDAPGVSPVEEADAAIGEHGSGVELKLATELRPWLHFDRGERWRPLEVNDFIAERFDDERGHGKCTRSQDPPCPDIDAAEDLREGVGYLDIHGNGRNGADFAPPDSGCERAPPAVECSKEGSVIYYRRTSYGGRWYWDYWWFLRYNDYNGRVNACRVLCGDHEGDWEGVTLITTASMTPEILAAIYATHRERVEVQAAALPLAGSHPLVFIAEGTHASYPFSCSRKCKQYVKIGTFRLPEESHDGSALWAHNDDGSCAAAECVRPLPETTAAAVDGLPFGAEWVAWGGLWGETCHAGCTGFRRNYESSPRSPGRQVRYRCPWVPTLVATPGVSEASRLNAVEVGDIKRQLAACIARRGGL